MLVLDTIEETFTLPRAFSHGGRVIRTNGRNTHDQLMSHSLFYEELYLRAIESQFLIYKGIWENETMFSSSVHDIINNPAYLHIINLGKAVVPFILRDMAQTHNHWFYALQLITYENPITREHQGNVNQMVNDWMNWARENNIEA